MMLALERLFAIAMGLVICIFISLLVFPIWASDELHDSMTSKFEDLAHSIEGCLEEYFGFMNEKKNQPTANFSSCKSILNSKAKDESLASFAKWEPWHGKFGLSYPWGKYLQIGDDLREIAATIVKLEGLLSSPIQPPPTLKEPFKEPCEAVGQLLAAALRELGESVLKMRRFHTAGSGTSMRVEQNSEMSPSKLKSIENGGLAVATFEFILMEMVEKVEQLAKKVEELGELADFRTQ